MATITIAELLKECDDHCALWFMYFLITNTIKKRYLRVICVNFKVICNMYV